MSGSVDRAALAGVAVAGVISVASAEGGYEPLDSVVGLVLLVLFVRFSLPGDLEPAREWWRPTAPAAVFALLCCLVTSPFIELLWVRADDDWRSLGISSTLCGLWGLFLWRASGAMRRVGRFLSPPQPAPTQNEDGSIDDGSSEPTIAGATRAHGEREVGGQDPGPPT